MASAKSRIIELQLLRLRVFFDVSGIWYLTFELTLQCYDTDVLDRLPIQLSCQIAGELHNPSIGINTSIHSLSLSRRQDLLLTIRLPHPQSSCPGVPYNQMQALPFPGLDPPVNISFFGPISGMSICRLR